MKKWILIAIVIAALLGFGIYQHHENTVVVQPTVSTTTTVPATDSSSDTDSSSTSTTSTTTAPTGAYKNGTYTGSVANAYYGNIQVSATVSGGKLTDVSFLQYPNDRGDSVRINSRAMPQLTSEAIAAQSANVNVVSGATDTSEAFMQSLASALSSAKA